MIQKIDELNREIWEQSTNNPEDCLARAREALRLAEKSEYSLGTAESLLNSGRCLVFLSELKKAGSELERSLELFRTIQGGRGEAGEMRALNLLGMRSHLSGDYETALNYYLMALSLSEQYHNDEVRIRVLNNIGAIHRLLNNIEEALSYYHKARTAAESSKHGELEAVALLNLGEVYLKIKDTDIAEEAIRKALGKAELSGYLQVKADSFLCLGRIELISEHYEKSERLLDESRAIYSRISDQNGTAEVDYRKGQIRQKTGQFTEAAALMDSAMETARRTENESLTRRCFRRKSEIEKALGNDKKALEYFERFYSMESAQRNDRVRNRLRKITLLYETEQKEMEKEAYRMQSLELEKTNKEIRFINEMGREITSSLELESIVLRTYRGLSQLLDVSFFGIAIYLEEEKSLDFRYFYNKTGKKITPFRIGLDSDRSVSVWCVKNRKPVIVRQEGDFYSYVTKAWRIENEHSQSGLFLPIIHRDKVVGCLTIQSQEENAYNEHHLEILGAISSFIAIALDNSSAHQELNKLNQIITTEKKGLEEAYRRIAHMANHDPLTDLPNRHLLNELLKKGIKIAKREKSRLAVFYMDLDMFKPINDTLGHGIGDLVLRIIGERMCSTLRSSDTVARIGGDEFVAVLYNCDTKEGLLSVADKIIKAVGKDLYLNEQIFTLGISIGISIYPDDGTEIDKLLLEADNAMYAAKNRGKNTAVFA